MIPTPLVHVTINGDLGSGKSTLARMIASHLGLELIQAGELQRSLAAERNLTTLQANLASERDAALDRQLDQRTTELATNALRPLVFDSRMAWHFVPRSFKIRLVTAPFTAATRIYQRQSTSEEAYDSVAHAVQLTHTRATSEARRYHEYYGVMINNPHNYDLIIDTSHLRSDEVLLLALAAIDVPLDRTLLLLNPKDVLAPRSKHSPERYPVEVEFVDGKFLALSSAELLEQAKRTKSPILRAVLGGGRREIG